MWTMLAGVPGKLKTLIDRLTATRAANLDNLNATISSRAPSSTALSSAVWTPAHAAKIALIGTPLLTLDRATIALADDITASHGSVGESTVLNIQGRGVINVISCLARSVSTSGSSSISGNVKVAIDGVEFAKSIGATAGSGGDNTVRADIIGGASGDPSTTVIWADQIPFNQSLVIKIQVTSKVNDLGYIRAGWRVRRVSDV